MDTAVGPSKPRLQHTTQTVYRELEFVQLGTNLLPRDTVAFKNRGQGSEFYRADHGAASFNGMGLAAERGIVVLMEGRAHGCDACESVIQGEGVGRF
ncbi:hypothetical protein FTW19_07465 [Terriglobus albidus]|uniref:Uncharacterized protein n=1 Tax=Terriglobus albidus TaxID=1592106 RepID=A0A5B9EC14_9BACT|nr:hypothetical protein FTW19_07465 [Terriglobus albidus]